jgi:antitoxin CptB
MDADTLNRLRWRARRGLLENDLLLTRFLDRHGATLDAPQAGAFSRLLELPDNDLFDLLLGRAEPRGDLCEPSVNALLQRLRAR